MYDKTLILDGPEMTPEELEKSISEWGKKYKLKDKNLILDGPPVMSPEEMKKSWIRSAEEKATNGKEKLKDK